MSEPSVAVIMPVHNRAGEAVAALRSVLAQTRQPQEIVIVDDASDPPFTLPEPMACDARIIVHRLAVNAGPAAARQAGLERVSASHVAFLDSDDAWRPRKLERQLATIGRAEGDLLAVATGWTWVGAGEPLNRIPKESGDIADFVAGSWFAPGSTVIMPTDAVRACGGFDGALRRLEDLDLFIRFVLAGGRLAVVPSSEAVIRRGRNARLATVMPAAARLEAKYGPRGSHGLPAPLLARLRAWLAVEQAAAARNEGAYARMVWHMARSFWLVPRRGVQLEAWWR